jgi:hypothetical protein
MCYSFSTANYTYETYSKYTLHAWSINTYSWLTFITGCYVMKWDVAAVPSFTVQQ